MKIIWADFYKRTMSGYISLGTPESARSIKQAGGIKVGEQITLTDGEMHVQAKVIKINGDTLFAAPDWTTVKKGTRMNKNRDSFPIHHNFDAVKTTVHVDKTTVRVPMDEKERVLKLTKAEQKISQNSAIVGRDISKLFSDGTTTWDTLSSLLKTHRLKVASGFASYLEKILRSHQMRTTELNLKDTKTKEAILCLWQSYLYLGKGLRILTNWFPKE